MVKKREIRFETWNKKRVVVYRINGKIQSWTYQKGSGLKSVNEAYKLIKKQNTFLKDTTRVSFKDSKQTINQKTKSIQIRGVDKTKTFKAKDVSTIRYIGKNTGALYSKEPLKGQSHYQYLARVKFGNTIIESYSKIGGDKKQAFTYARQEAIQNRSIIGYDWSQSGNLNEGRFTSPDGTRTVIYTAEYTVVTYVNTTQKQFIPQRIIDR